MEPPDQPPAPTPRQPAAQRLSSPGPWSVIAVDTNILVYSHREDSEFHLPAGELIESLRNGSSM